MHAAGGQNGSHLEDQLRVVIVDSPDRAAPLLDALDVADIGAWRWVEAERALYFSPRALTLLGIPLEPRADLLGRFFRGIHPDDQDEVGRLLRREYPAGAFRLRYRFTPPDGPLRWIEDHGRVERNSAGALTCQGGVMREVTHEVGRELERREADARLEALLNAMPFAVWGRSGRDLVVTHQNAASIDAYGDIRGRTLREAADEVRARWESQLAEVLSGQVVRSRHEAWRHGELRVLREIIAPVIVADEVTGAVGVAIDVTDEARADRFAAMLTEMSADFASRASDQLDAAISASLERIARFIGAPIAVLCEVTGDDRVHLTHWWIDPATGQERPRHVDLDAAPMRRVLRRLAGNTAMVLRSREDLPADSEERAWLAARHVESFAIVPTRQSDGTQTVLVLGADADRLVDWPDDTIPSMRMTATLLGGVAARARAEASQRAVERRMQEAQKLDSLGVLAGGIAHDFNNLLTVILGHASLLRAEFGGVEGLSPSLDQIEAASQRAADLCRQMLAYAGRGRFTRQVIDLNTLIRELQSLLQVTVPKHAKLDLSLASRLPPVLADESQIRQLIMNLVINASEALNQETGTITITSSSGPRSAEELSATVFSPQLAEGEYVSLAVRDSGEGMTVDTASRIFDPFFTTKFTGRGLGLAAVVGIVRAHRGALRVDTRVGEGSTFELLLPVHESTSPAAPAAPSPTRETALDAWRTSGTVLVVDDEAGVRNLVHSVLSRAGMDVILREDGESGVETFRAIADQVRLVLLDLTMPVLDGHEALRELRAIRPDVPVILMSGYSPDAIDASAHALLQKPFTPAALIALVRRLLDVPETR